MTIAIDYNGTLLVPGLVNGVATASYYALLAIPLVMAYRVSHTVAFVNGGIAVAGGLMWGYLSFDSRNVTFAQPDLAGGVALVIVAGGGAVLGGAYGLLVSGHRLSKWPEITITNLSLGVMLLLVGGVSSLFSGAFETVPSPFGEGRVQIGSGQMSHHQVYVIGFTLALVAASAWVMARTRFGIRLRAIADNSEASLLVGVPRRAVGATVYAAAGAISATCGALIVPDIGTEIFSIVFIFLRALTVSVLGGFGSVSLALIGSMVFGIADSTMRSGVFGDVSGGAREMVAVGLLFILVILIQRLRPGGKDLFDLLGSR